MSSLVYSLYSFPIISALLLSISLTSIKAHRTYHNKTVQFPPFDHSSVLVQSKQLKESLRHYRPLRLRPFATAAIRAAPTSSLENGRPDDPATYYISSNLIAHPPPYRANYANRPHHRIEPVALTRRTSRTFIEGSNRDPLS